MQADFNKKPCVLHNMHITFRPSSNPPSEQIKMCWEQEAPGETPGAPGSHVAAKTFGLKSCGDGKKL